MKFLTIILFVGLIVSFVMWGYFAAQTLRNKQGFKQEVRGNERRKRITNIQRR